MKFLELQDKQWLNEYYYPVVNIIQRKNKLERIL